VAKQEPVRCPYHASSSVACSVSKNTSWWRAAIIPRSMKAARRPQVPSSATARTSYQNAHAGVGQAPRGPRQGTVSGSELSRHGGAWAAAQAGVLCGVEAGEPRDRPHGKARGPRGAREGRADGPGHAPRRAIPLPAFERRYTERRHASAASSEKAHTGGAVENREHFASNKECAGGARYENVRTRAPLRVWVGSGHEGGSAWRQ
jgi:hypothetical protein